MIIKNSCLPFFVNYSQCFLIILENRSSFILPSPRIPSTTTFWHMAQGSFQRATTIGSLFIYNHMFILILYPFHVSISQDKPEDKTTIEMRTKDLKNLIKSYSGFH